MRRCDIKKVLDQFQQIKYNYTIWIVANVNETVQDEESFIRHAKFTEFFSKAEFAAIASAITEEFGYTRIFYSETEFMQYVLAHLKRLTKDILVFNFTRDGIFEGKKSLIPAFCDLYGLKYVGSNAFVTSLLRNKFVYTKFLDSLNIPVPITTCSNLVDKENFECLHGREIIIKNICESASIGMDETNIQTFPNYSYLIEQIRTKCQNMKTTNLLLQEFIPGEECEVFVVRKEDILYAFPPIALNINGSPIITSQISDEYDYTFSPLSNILPLEICNSIQKTTEKAAKILNIKTYARFDYRISKNGQYYLIDIAGSPYLTRHSSIEYLFTKILNLRYSDIFLLILALTLKNYSHEVNCKSDKGNPLEV